MKKLFVMTLLALGTCSMAQAQISQGVPSATKIRTGNRMQQGDYGIYLGATSDLFKGIGKSDFSVKALPLVNFKYMMTDNWEARVGLEFYRSKEKVSGDLIVGVEDEKTGETKKTAELNQKFVEADNRIMPGIAYHFSNSNILDVYAGVEGTLGWTRNDLFTSNSYDGKDNTFNVCKSAFQLGGGAFIGLQAFIGNLPLAVGVEYGISARWDAGLSTKTYQESADDDMTVFTPDASQFANLQANGCKLDGQYESLRAAKGKIANQVRFTLTYFFKAN